MFSEVYNHFMEELEEGAERYRGTDAYTAYIQYPDRCCSHIPCPHGDIACARYFLSHAVIGHIATKIDPISTMTDLD